MVQGESEAGEAGNLRAAGEPGDGQRGARANGQQAERAARCGVAGRDQLREVAQATAQGDPSARGRAGRDVDEGADRAGGVERVGPRRGERAGRRRGGAERGDGVERSEVEVLVQRLGRRVEFLAQPERFVRLAAPDVDVQRGEEGLRGGGRRPVGLGGDQGADARQDIVLVVIPEAVEIGREGFVADQPIALTRDHRAGGDGHQTSGGGVGKVGTGVAARRERLRVQRDIVGVVGDGGVGGIEASILAEFHRRR